MMILVSLTLSSRVTVYILHRYYSKVVWHGSCPCHERRWYAGRFLSAVYFLRYSCVDRKKSMASAIKYDAGIGCAFPCCYIYITPAVLPLIISLHLVYTAENEISDR